MVIFDHDGDYGPGMCSSDSPSLPSDHHDTILGKLAAAHFVAQLAAVREVPTPRDGHPVSTEFH